MEFFLAMIENATFRQDPFEVQLEQYRRSEEWLRNLAQSGQLLNVNQFDGEPSKSCDQQRGSSLHAAPFTGEGETFTGYVIVQAKDFDGALETARSAKTWSAIEFRALPQFCISTPIPFTSSMFK